MLYPASVVDGIVHQLGGTKLGVECKKIHQFYGGCPTGMAVATTQGEEALLKCYDRIIHTAPPFYQTDQNLNDLLRACYRSSIQLAFSCDHVKVACPLLGAGARGFPLEVAVTIAANESITWRDADDDTAMKKSNWANERLLMFGIPDLDVGENLVTLIQSVNFDSNILVR